VVVARAGLNSRMQGLSHLRTIEVILSTGAILHKAHEFELGAIQFRSRVYRMLYSVVFG
jgi:hypothetical protein